jgi:transcriptional regulator with XRE-family HTH domain
MWRWFIKIGHRITAILEEKNLSKADLARMIGVSRAAVSDWTRELGY